MVNTEVKRICKQAKQNGRKSKRKEIKIQQNQNPQNRISTVANVGSALVKSIDVKLIKSKQFCGSNILVKMFDRKIQHFQKTHEETNNLTLYQE
jgi:hypothetical protein